MRRGTWQAHTKDFDRCRHGVGSVHSTTATRARAGITLKIFHFFSSHVTMVPFPDPFENRNQVDILTVQITWSNGSSVGKNSRNIHVGNGNHRSWHVLVTATDGHKGIHVVPPHSRFDRVRNDITRSQGEAHPRRSHSDPIRNRNGSKLNRPSSRIFYTFFGQFPKIMQVHVTRCVFSPSRDYPYDWFFKVFICHPSCPKHSPVRGFDHAVVYTTAMACI